MRQKQFQEQINKPEKLRPGEQQSYRNKLYFESELRKLVPDLLYATDYGYLDRDQTNNFNYYTSGEPNVRHLSYFQIKNGIIEFTGILNGSINKFPIQDMDNRY